MLELIFQFILANTQYISDVTLIIIFGFMAFYTYKSKVDNKQTKESVKWLEEERKNSIPALSDKMKEVVKKSSTINQELDLMTGDLKADRGWLYLFHNTGYDFLGQPFARVTNTNESTAPGIDSKVSYMKDVPVGLLSCYVVNLVEHGKAFYPDVENIIDTDRTAYNYFSDAGIKSTYAICLFAPKVEHAGDDNIKGYQSKGEIPLGFVGVDYIRNKKELDDEQLKKLHEYVMVIKGLLVEQQKIELDHRSCFIDM